MRTLHACTLLLPALFLRPCLAQRALLDVVSLAFSYTCVSERSVAALNQHLGVRHIHIVTTSSQKCNAFARLAENVKCHMQDALLSGVSLDTVTAHMTQHFQDRGSQRTARDRAGWYLQQVLKLGAAQAIPDLTVHFIVWDLDMIPLYDFPVLFQPAAPAANLRTRVDVATIQIREYAASYRKLFGRGPLYPGKDMSYVAHWMVVYKPYMSEMLAHISGTEDTASWPWKVLESVQPGHRNVYYGLSEYTMYVSWVLQNRPGACEVMDRKLWMRVAPRQHEWLLARNFTQCCPDDAIVEAARAMGWAYLGWELGGKHAPECEKELTAPL
jgi:hypothetical protein